MDKRAAQVFSKLMKFKEEAEAFAVSVKSYLLGGQFLT
jgi:hypothetical protein